MGVDVGEDKYWIQISLIPQQIYFVLYPIYISYIWTVQISKIYKYVLFLFFRPVCVSCRQMRCHVTDSSLWIQLINHVFYYFLLSIICMWSDLYMYIYIYWERERERERERESVCVCEVGKQIDWNWDRQRQKIQRHREIFR